MEAVVKFSYAKEQDDELSLTIGEVIKEVSKIEEGWCEGTLNGVRGVFPENFVELRTAKSEPIKSETPKLRAESSDKARKRRAKVAFSYTAENEDELSLTLGDVVEILGDDEEGWWRGRINGKEGVFPCNFVEPIAEEEEPPPYTNLMDTNPPPAPSKPEKNGRPVSMVAIPGLGAGINPLDLKQKLKPVSTNRNPLPHLNELPPKSAPERPAPPSSRDQSQKNLKAKVMFPYNADQEDEITIKEGDIVDVITMVTEQDGWWLVRLGNNEGLVPDNFLSLIQSGAPSTTNLNAPKVPAGTSDIKSIETPDNPPLPPKTTPVTRPPPPGAQPVLPGAQQVLPKLPSKSTGDLPRLPSKQPDLSDKKESTDEFDIPRQDLLDNSTAKEKPKRTARPPSRNTSGVDITSTDTQDDEIEGRTRAPSSGKAPWQEELSKRKPKLTPPTPPPPHTSNVPVATPPKPAPSTRPKPVVSKPSKPPPVKSTPDHSKETSSPITIATPTKPSPPTSSSTPVKVPPPAVVTKEETKPKPAPPTPDDAAAWKEAFEQLKEQFKKFQENIRQEMQKEIETLAEDLDNERKKTASMQIDIDRLKKAREYRDNL